MISSYVENSLHPSSNHWTLECLIKTVRWVFATFGSSWLQSQRSGKLKRKAFQMLDIYLKITWCIKEGDYLDLMLVRYAFISSSTTVLFVNKEALQMIRKWKKQVIFPRSIITLGSNLFPYAVPSINNNLSYRVFITYCKILLSARGLTISSRESRRIRFFFV